jgi:hypothetical protein
MEKECMENACCLRVNTLGPARRQVGRQKSLKKTDKNSMLTAHGPFAAKYASVRRRLIRTSGISSHRRGGRQHNR